MGWRIGGLWQRWKFRGSRSVPDDVWLPFDGGSTIGQSGSEDGTILQDDEHPFGARITLEQAAPFAPFAITCGIYGLMFHTRYFESHSLAYNEYDRMRESLGEILARIDNMAHENEDDRLKLLAREARAFVERFP